MNGIWGAPRVNRWYVRCTDCLTVAAVEVAPSGGMACGICGGRVESMGRVAGDHLVHDSERCACDERCTSARGPICNCKCGGRNHGTNRTVTVTVRAGDIPVVNMPDPEKALAQVAEYRAALATAAARIQPLRQSRTWLPRDQFDRLRLFQREMAAAQKAKSHAGRMKKLTALLTA